MTVEFDAPVSRLLEWLLLPLDAESGGASGRRVASAAAPAHSGPHRLGGWEARVLPTADGWVVAQPSDHGSWERARALVAAALADPPVHGDQFLRSLTSAECEDRFQELRQSVVAVTSARSDVRSASIAEVSNPTRLRGCTVVDLTGVLAGPLLTGLLVDLGAAVIRVERPGADPGTRSSPPNAGKQMRLLDLNEPDGWMRFDDCLADADLLVCSFSRRAMDNWGLTSGTLLDRHPRLQVLSLPAFEASRRRRNWIALGHGIAAASGWLFAAADGTPQLPAFPFPDLLTAVVGCRSALRMLSEPATGPRWRELPQVAIASACRQVAVERGWL